MSFQACLPIVLQSEGGYVDDPQDPGGATNLGVTLKTWEAYVGHQVSKADIRALTVEEVSPLYELRYYNASHANDCPAGVDLMVFDAAVNQGVSRAVKSLQKCVGVTADGAFGPATKAALEAKAPVALINAIAADRAAYYRSLPTFAHFGKGWMARVDRTKAAALQMAG